MALVTQSFGDAGNGALTISVTYNDQNNLLSSVTTVLLSGSGWITLDGVDRFQIPPGTTTTDVRGAGKSWARPCVAGFRWGA